MAFFVALNLVSAQGVATLTDGTSRLMLYFSNFHTRKLNQHGSLSPPPLGGGDDTFNGSLETVPNH
jgi:hypothetical protein